jgi:hypothetical protein
MRSSRNASVKVIQATDYVTLENQINMFIEKSVTELLDIKYSTFVFGEQSTYPCYTALIIYE